MEGTFKVYKSSAGSGKTYTLVKEFLRICLTSDDLYGFSRILAITFTNKATFEMKHRILLALKQIGNQDEKVIQLTETLKEETGLGQAEIIDRCDKTLTAILHSYADFGISTIDKFTHRLVRTFAKDLSLSPTFKVELDPGIILDQVIDLLIDKLGIDEELTELIIRFAFARMDEEKAWKIDKELFKFANEFFQEKSFPYLKELRELKPSVYDDTIENYTKWIKNFEKQVKSIGKDAMDLVEKAGVQKESFYNRAAIYTYFFRFKNVDIAALAPSSTAVTTVEQDKWHAGKCTAEQAAEIDGIKDRLAELFHEGVALHDANIKTYWAVSETLKNLHSLSLLNHIEKRLAEFKKEEKILNISDFNTLISSIVEQEPMPFIYERLGDKYQHLMIDEFQDTSVLQFSNLLPLVENSLSQGFENLIVGDAKQAIYRFRGGEVGQFSEMPNYQLPEIRHNDLYAERMQTLGMHYNSNNLEINYRSLKEVVDFNNAFFEFAKNDSTLTPKIAAIFEEHTQSTLPSKTGGYVQIQFVEGARKGDRLPAYNQSVLNAITTSLQNGYQLKDIAILVRKKADGREVAEFLKAEGINVLSSEALLLENDATVRFLIRFAQWVFQPEIHLFQKDVLEYLVEQKWLKGTLHENYLKYIDQSANLLADIGLDFSTSQLKLKAPHEFFEELIRQFKLNEQYNVYVQFLQDVVFDYFKSNSGTIHSFLLWWEDNQDQFTISSSDDNDAVSVMTIHKSKGLEFPICIIPYAEQEIAHAGPFRQNLIWSDTLSEPGSHLPYALVEFNGRLRDSLLHKSYDEELAKSQIDFMCDNYVAFTRAVDALYIMTSQVKPSKSKKDPNSGLLKLPELIAAFVASKSLEADDNGVILIGELPQNKIKKALETDESVKLNYLSSKWSDKIKISVTSQSAWKENEPIQYGILMHEILGEIHDAEDVAEVLERYRRHGALNQNEYEVMGEKLNQLLRKKQIIPFFDAQYKVKQEAGMLSSQGKLLRPDRVVFWDNKVAVLDFKTGEKNEAHHEQIKEYQSVLEDISQLEVEGYLLYTETEELVKV